MNIYGSLMDIFDQKKQRHLCRKKQKLEIKQRHLCRKNKNPHEQTRNLQKVFLKIRDSFMEIIYYQSIREIN